MAGRTKWSDIEAQLSPERRAAVEARVDEIHTSLRLDGLRKARGLTQEEMADLLDAREMEVPKLEGRTDVRVSTLRSVIEAMAGEMEIRARFPDAEYMIDVSGEDARVQRVDAAASPTTPVPPPATRARSRR